MKLKPFQFFLSCTEIKNWTVLLSDIFYHINFNLNVKNNFEDVYVIKYKPMSFSADFIKDGKVNFRTQPKGTKVITS